MTEVLAPCPGRVVPLSATGDPVFAAEMVGPGVAIDPEPGQSTVVSPIAGKVVKVHPHAFVVLGADGVGVLVHLGINTVRLEGKGSRCWSSRARAWPPGIRWCGGTRPPSPGEDISTMVPVVAMDRPKGSVPAPAEGSVAAIGDVLFTVTP